MKRASFIVSAAIALGGVSLVPTLATAATVNSPTTAPSPLISNDKASDRATATTTARVERGVANVVSAAPMPNITAWKHTFGSESAISKSHNLFSGSFTTMNRSHGLAEMRLPLVAELTNHVKIQASNTLTAQKLRANLPSGLTAASSRSAHLPGSEIDGSRMVAHHVPLAVLDAPPQAHQNLAAPTTNSSGIGDR